MFNARPDYKRIKTAAEDILEKYDIKYPPVPVKSIVENEGVDVVFVKFSTFADKVAGFTKFDEEKIYVNADDNINRQLFTIAHEFGHWILHKELFLKNPENYNILLRTPGKINNDPIEKEANAFAGAILAPASILNKVKNNATVAELAHVFAISPEAMLLRLKRI